jgi:hypothetical protein
MAKVFRLHPGSDTIEGWEDSSPYGRNAIDSIKDPDGETSSREITSIPSPFARMDLVKTAFEKVCRSEKGLDSNSSFHKMVSDTLDVAELFFNLDKLRDKLRVIVWNKNRSLDSLINSPNKKHRQLGKTLELYFNQDNGYNFDSLDNVYLLDYLGGPNQMNIIGGTSPRTLFFTNANDLSYVDIRFGSDLVFDNNYRPLYKRDDIEFILYLYALQKSDVSFRNYFTEFDEYLNECYQHLSMDVKNKIQQFNSNTLWQNYKKISVTGDNQMIEIIQGVFLGKSDLGITSIKESDFILNSTAQIDDLPLVLPNTAYTGGLKYTTSAWDPSYKAPYTDSRTLADRTLPYLTDKYPYLTVDDFLQPYLIQTVYATDKKRFFDGNASGFSENEGCILPLKRAYFDYFDCDDLKKTYSDGKRVFEITKGKTGGVQVTLRLPIQKGNYVTFERTYYPSSEPEIRLPDIDIERNKGGLITNTFGLAIFPNFKLTKENYQDHYRVAFYEADVKTYSKNNKYDLYFGNSFNKLNANPKIDRNVDKSNKADHQINSKYYLVQGNFDFLEVDDGNGHKGILLPSFDEYTNGGKKFKVAIDFGTTNTHIEYSVDGSEPTAFEIKENEIQEMTLHQIGFTDFDERATIISDAGFEMVEFMDREFLPRYINKEFDRSFPQRTAVTHFSNLNFNSKVDPLLDINIPFFYEKKLEHRGFESFTDLKWAQYQEQGKSKTQVQNYFAVLLMLIRNKIVINGGNLDATEIIWFYPSSMSSHKISTLNNLWNELCATYISPNVRVIKLSESIAPFYYYRNRLSVTASDRPVISVDIGGGTSDVVVYQENKAMALTSFKFAGNALYGDGFNSNPSMNGFVQRYFDKFSQILTENQSTLTGILNSIYKKNSSDIVSFFYSLEQNSSVNRKIEINFSKMLEDDSTLKPVILLFVGSILYHIAELMKYLKMPIPRFMIFSGTGSKVINILDSSKNSELINRFAEEIFAKVYERSPEKLELRKVDHPKEITCKGGLFMQQSEEVMLSDIKKVHIGDKMTSKVTQELKYNEIDPTLKSDVISGLVNFLDIFEQVDRKISYKDKFGIEQINYAELKEIIVEGALSSINDGLELKLKEISMEDALVEETLFFYPLIQGLNKFAYKCHQKTL